MCICTTGQNCQSDFWQKFSSACVAGKNTRKSRIRLKLAALLREFAGLFFQSFFQRLFFREALFRRINTAVELFDRYGRIEDFPSNVRSKQRKLALLFKNLATLRTDPPFSRRSKSCAGAVRPLRSPRHSWKKGNKSAA
jgi:hypothetical protein